MFINVFICLHLLINCCLYSFTFPSLPPRGINLLVNFKLRANGRNNSRQCCVRLYGAKILTGFKLCATTWNRVSKQMQHVTSNNVGSCWPTMLRPFAWGLRGTNFCTFLFFARSLLSELVIKTVGNGPFVRWCRFTTKTRIHFVFPFIFKFGSPSEV